MYPALHEIKGRNRDCHRMRPRKEGQSTAPGLSIRLGKHRTSSRLGAYCRLSVTISFGVTGVCRKRKTRKEGILREQGCIWEG